MLFFLGIIFQFITANGQVSFLRVCLTVTYGLILGFIFWWLGLWPAGDAKLFTTLLLFFPAHMYFSPGLIFDYLVNIFVPIFFFMMVLIISKARLKLLKDAIKYSFEPYKVFMLATMFLGFVWFSMKLLALFNIRSDFFLSILLLFIVYELSYTVLTFQTEIFFVACAILRVIIDYKNLFTHSYILEFILTIVIFIFFRFFVLYIGYHTYTKRVKIKDLKPGMSLAEGIFIHGNRVQKTSFLLTSFIDFLSKRKYKFIHDLNALSPKDVEVLKSMEKEGKLPFDDVLVSQRQHFAFFILLGFLLTLFMGTNFISYSVLMMKT